MTKNEYKTQIKTRLANLMVKQFTEASQDYIAHPNLYTTDEATRYAVCREAVAELYDELTNPAGLCACPDCGSLDPCPCYEYNQKYYEN